MNKEGVGKENEKNDEVVTSEKGCANSYQAHLDLLGCSNRRWCLLVEATQLALVS